MHNDHQDRAERCRYCPRPIALDGRGIWKHAGTGYQCRDATGVTLKSYATPVEPWPAVTPPGYVPVVSNSAVGRAAVPRRTR
jgi:hypothetical protein